MSDLRRASAAVLIAAFACIGLSGCAVGALSSAVEAAIEEAQGADAGGSGPDSDSGSDEDYLPEGEDSDEGNTAMDFIREGDCLNDEEVSNDEDVTTVSSLDVVDCADPHDSEVFGFVTYDGDDFPTEEDLYDIADQGCFDLFEPYVGADYDVSSLDFSYYTPTRSSWKYGDRDAMCVLYDLDEKTLTGTARDSGI